METIKVARVKLGNRSNDDVEKILNELISTPERVIAASVVNEHLEGVIVPVLLVVYSQYGNYEPTND